MRRSIRLVAPLATSRLVNPRIISTTSYRYYASVKNNSETVDNYGNKINVESKDAGRKDGFDLNQDASKLNTASSMKDSSSSGTNKQNWQADRSTKSKDATHEAKTQPDPWQNKNRESNMNRDARGTAGQGENLSSNKDSSFKGSSNMDAKDTGGYGGSTGFIGGADLSSSSSSSTRSDDANTTFNSTRTPHSGTSSFTGKESKRSYSTESYNRNSQSKSDNIKRGNMSGEEASKGGVQNSEFDANRDTYLLKNNLNAEETRKYNDTVGDLSNEPPYGPDSNINRTTAAESGKPFGTGNLSEGSDTPMSDMGGRQSTATSNTNFHTVGRAGEKYSDPKIPSSPNAGYSSAQKPNRMGTDKTGTHSTMGGGFDMTRDESRRYHTDNLRMNKNMNRGDSTSSSSSSAPFEKRNSYDKNKENLKNESQRNEASSDQKRNDSNWKKDSSNFDMNRDSAKKDAGFDSNKEFNSSTGKERSEDIGKGTQSDKKSWLPWTS